MNNIPIGIRGVLTDINERKLAEQEILNRTRELKVLIKCCQSLSATLNLGTVLQVTTDSIIELMDLQSAAIYLIEEKMLYLGATSPALPPQFPEEWRFASLSDHPHILEAITTRLPVFVPNTKTANFTPAELNISEGRGLGSILYLPLLIGSNVIGALIVSKVGEPRALSSSEIDLCQTLASLSALAVENSRLYEQAKKEITERIRTELELAKAKEKAELANKLKDAFIANMSHEIRTPLNGILGMSSIIMETFRNRMEDSDEKLFEGIHISSKRIMRTIEEILNYSRLHVGEFLITKKSFSISSVCSALVIEYTSAAINKSLKLSFKNNYGDGHLFGDEYSITMAVSNLLDNAIKYTEKGFISVMLCKEHDDEIILEITDSGIGIDDEYLETIFEPYRQVQMGYGRSYEGVGLGLAITKKILDLNDAVLTVISKKGKGSTFTIKFRKENCGQ